MQSHAMPMKANQIVLNAFFYFFHRKKLWLGVLIIHFLELFSPLLLLWWMRDADDIRLLALSSAKMRSSCEFIEWITFMANLMSHRIRNCKNVKILYTTQGVAENRLWVDVGRMWCAMKFKIAKLQHKRHSHSQRERGWIECIQVLLIGIENPAIKCITIVELNNRCKYHAVRMRACSRVREWQINMAKMINDQIQSINDNDRKEMLPNTKAQCTQH